MCTPAMALQDSGVLRTTHTGEQDASQQKANVSNQEVQSCRSLLVMSRGSQLPGNSCAALKLARVGERI